MNEKRLQNLEETLSHQDRQIADLSEMLILQGREISRLGLEIRRLSAKIEAAEESASNGEQDSDALSPTDFAAQNKPPHW
ncbi:MAG: SlyX family protein [Alphaproteobacteria bacterium]